MSGRLDRCINEIGVEHAADPLVHPGSHAEAIEHIGETKCWVSDLEKAWTREIETARAISFSAPAPTCSWRGISPRRGRRCGTLSPRLSTTTRWQRSDGVVENLAHGRRGAGTQNHCLHGKDAVIEDVIDWRPFDYVMLTALLPMPGAAKILMSYTFEDGGGGGTHFEFCIAKPKPKDLPFYERVRPAIQANFTAGFDIPALHAGGTSAAFGGRGRAASASLARTLRDPAALGALAHRCTTAAGPPDEAKQRFGLRPRTSRFAPRMLPDRRKTDTNGQHGVDVRRVLTPADLDLEPVLGSP